MSIRLLMIYCRNITFNVVQLLYSNQLYTCHFHWLPMKILILIAVITLPFLTTGCASLSPSEVSAKREDLVKMANQTVEILRSRHPEISSELDKAIAYGVADMKLTKVPIVGAGGGEGVLFITNEDKRIFYNITRIDFGGGWGARAYKVLIVFSDSEVVKDWEEGKWKFEAGAEVSAGSKAAEGASGGNPGFTTHLLSEIGASATVTARVIHIKVNKELTK